MKDIKGTQVLDISWERSRWLPWAWTSISWRDEVVAWTQ